MATLTPEPDREELTIRYSGAALDDHSMDVRQLAPSLLGLADLFVIAHNRVGPALALPPALEVHAQRGGSFLVDLFLSAQDASETLVGAMAGRHATAVANGAGIGSAVLTALLWTRNRRRRGRETSVVEVEPGTIRVNWADGTVLEAPIEAQELVANMDFNRAAGRVFEPLRHDGIQ